MLYLLIILFPVTMAATCFVLRKRTNLVVAVALGAVLTQTVLLSQVPINAPTRFLGVTLTVTALNQLFVLLFLAMIGLLLIAAWHLPQGENFVAVTLLILALVSSILLLQDPFIVSLLLVGAALAAVLAIVDLPAGSGRLVEARAFVTALRYVTMMTLAGVLLYFSFVLADVYQPGVSLGSIRLARFILALLTAGFALRLALVPFHAWLPDLIDDASPLVAGLIIAILNTTNLLVLLLSFQRFPVLLVENSFGLFLMRLGGLATVTIAGLLALGQPTLRRTVAYLLIYGSGMVFYGLVATSVRGLTGALLDALNQVLAVVLIFVSLAQLDQPDGRSPIAEGRRDLLWRWPVASMGLLCGLLIVLGLPPFGSFASRLLIYQAALELGWYELAPLLLATLFGGLALLRLARDWFLGAQDVAPNPNVPLLTDTEFDQPTTAQLTREPRTLALVMALLVAMSLTIGLYPQPLLQLVDEVVRGLTFIQLL